MGYTQERDTFVVSPIEKAITTHSNLTRPTNPERWIPISGRAIQVKDSKGEVFAVMNIPDFNGGEGRVVINNVKDLVDLASSLLSEVRFTHTNGFGDRTHFAAALTLLASAIERIRDSVEFQKRDFVDRSEEYRIDVVSEDADSWVYKSSYDSRISEADAIDVILTAKLLDYKLDWQEGDNYPTIVAVVKK